MKDFMHAGIDRKERYALHVQCSATSTTTTGVFSAATAALPGVCSIERQAIAQDEIEGAAAEAGEERPVSGGMANLAGAIGGLKGDATVAEIGDGFGPNRRPEALQAPGRKVRLGIDYAMDRYGYLRGSSGRKRCGGQQEIPPCHRASRTSVYRPARKGSQVRRPHGTTRILSLPFDRRSGSIYFLEESPMPCKPEVLKNVPLFSLLDDDELAVLASQVELKTFAPRERIYKIGSSAPQAYVLISGSLYYYGRRGSSGGGGG